MDYKELTISMPKEKVDLISTFLVVAGYDTFEIRDLGDIIENADKMYYDYIEDELLERKDEPPEIKFYFEKDSPKAEEIQKYILGVADSLGMNDVSCKILNVEGSDWDTKWKKYFYPFPVGESLFIKPSWESVSPEMIKNRRVIEIDPASAFGSGTHATTKLCLEALEKHIFPSAKVLDMGAGSGILGIGALHLGAEKVFAVDIDENAVKICKENFVKNNCPSEKWEAECGNVLENGELLEKIPPENDLILANIVAQVICLMSDIFYEKLKKGGKLITSGILSERKEEVLHSLTKSGFELISSETLDEWVCMVLRKP